MPTTLRRIALVGLLIVGNGCAAPYLKSLPPTATLSPRALIDLDADPNAYRPYDPRVAVEFLRSGRGPFATPGEGPRKSILTLSGGGMFGAFTAGVLKGWTASGTRPTFDAVTGISTGALIAPLAFLGPEYDGFLEQRYTTLKTADILRNRNILSLLTADSLTDSSPLRALIAGEITEDVLARIARAHAQGRRLYIGTTNLESKRLAVWDMGAIASSSRPGRLELFRQVILASCSFPGVLPPVSIDIVVDGRPFTEIHADGGVVASIFLDMSMLTGQAPGGGPLDTVPEAVNVFAIVAGKLYNDPAPVKRRLLSVAEESLTGVLQARTEGDLVRLFLLANLTGGRFHLAAVPQEMPVSSNFLAFDPAEMRRLFDYGYDFGQGGGPWRTTPPGGNVDEQRLPRSGIHFSVVPGSKPIVIQGQPERPRLRIIEREGGP